MWHPYSCLFHFTQSVAMEAVFLVKHATMVTTAMVTAVQRNVLWSVDLYVECSWKIAMNALVCVEMGFLHFQSRVTTEIEYPRTDVVRIAKSKPLLLVL